MFDEDARLHNSLNEFVLEIIYNHYTDELWDIEFLNAMDREEMGEQFASSYIGLYCSDLPSDEGYANKLSMYASKEIDRLIPKIYFLEVNIDLCRKYTPLLARRIYDINGKDGFDTTSGLRYQYDHDFTEEKTILKESMATEKQISYLQKLGKEDGYLLWHEEFLSKNYANQMIAYLSEKVYEQPVIFSFFFVSK